MPTLLEAAKVSAAAAIAECDRCAETGNASEIRAFLDHYDGSEASKQVIAHIVNTLGERPPPMEAALALATLEAVGLHTFAEYESSKDTRKAISTIQRFRLVDLENKTHCMLRDTIIAELHLASGEYQADRVIEQAPSVADVPVSEIKVRARYFNIVASLLNRKRRYLDAATKYIAAAKTDRSVASQSLTSALVCALLAPSSDRQKAILKQLSADECQVLLGPLAHVTQRVFKMQVLRKTDMEAVRAASVGAQLTPAKDARSPVDAAIIRHNVFAVAAIYYNISIAELAAILGVSEEEAESEVHAMIVSGSLAASIDQGQGFIAFQADAAAPLREWDETINAVCVDVAAVADAVERLHPSILV